MAQMTEGPAYHQDITEAFGFRRRREKHRGYLLL
jgi:hypothetical protein